ncbi:MAG: spore maturation protein [Bacteroidota bacterium]|nr:MAG: spore maturation protein [Bacteroidota bacterium]
MVLNYIWIGFFLVAFMVALLRVAGYYLQQHVDWFGSIVFDAADRDVFGAIVDSSFVMAESSVKITIYLIGIMALWLGIMKIGEKGGAVQVLARITSPFFTRIFPEVPKDHPAMGSMLMNITANMLGLDNAATPLGLKAMNELQQLNKQPDTASNAQIMFLVLNASGLTIIPVSIMGLRAAANAANPADVFLPILMATFVSTLVGLVLVSLIQRINLFHKIVLAYLGGTALFIASLFFLLAHLDKSQIEIVSRFAGSFIIFSIIIFFFLLAIRKKINLYEVFIEGAREGFEVAVKIIPYLVAMLFAIGVFRASGTLDWIVGGFQYFFAAMGFDTRFVPALPTALMKPLSGSGARGMMVETMQNYGADSFAGRLSSIFQGSTETTFYIIAVYFGSVNIRKTRYAVTAGLVADLAGVIAAIFVAYLFFGN